jgi:dihydropteroate synthase
LAGFEAARSIERTEVMGVLNLTPDSFSDGGRWEDPEQAVEQGLRMVAEGATILDLGGESTRPGAQAVPEDEELRRVLPVVRRLRAQTQARISVDTRKSRVATACLEAGADWINDVSGLTYDPELASAVARFPEVRLVLMHFRRRPEEDRFSTEYDAAGRPVYDDLVGDTLRWLRVRVRAAIDAGVDPGRLWIDPGFGFGKTPAQNVELLRRLREYTSVGLPVLVGTSRKSTVGRLVGNLPPDQRLEGTAATVVWAIANGASAIRVHDVPQMSRLARAADALRTGVLD